MSAVQVGSGLVVAAVLLLRSWETWSLLSRPFPMPRIRFRWLELGVTLIVAWVAAMSWRSIADLRELVVERRFSIIASAVAGEAELLDGFARRTLSLLALWGCMLGAGCGFRAGRACPQSRKAAVALCWTGGIAFAGGLFMVQRALRRWVSLRSDTAGRDPRFWLEHFESARQELFHACLLLAGAVGACFIVAGFVRGRRQAELGEPSVGAAQLRTAVRLRAGLLALSGVACVWVWKATRPFAEEALRPLPVDHAFANTSLAIWRPPPLSGTGPDDLAEGPVVHVDGTQARVDGVSEDFEGVFRALKNKRELWLQLYAADRDRLAQPFPGVVLVDAAPGERVENIESVLTAARAAGFFDARLTLSHWVELQRPVLGKLAGVRVSAVRLELRVSATECRTPHFVPPNHDSAASYATLIDTLLEVRRKAEPVCKLVSARSGSEPTRAPVARRIRVHDVDFDALEVANEPPSIEVRYSNHAGEKLGSLRALRRDVEAEGLELVMGMNAGMFTPARRPVGLLVVRGAEQAPLDLGNDVGNFYLKPNGVFSVLRDGQVGILPSETQKSVPSGSVWFATQSGPLLLFRGQEHPAVRPDSHNRHLRNAVGVSGRRAIFVISRAQVTFHELTLALRQLGCDDGLYLDGTVSRMYAPLLDRFDEGGDFGPLLAVVRARR